MHYLYGDSTESDLEFNYLAFLRQALDCAVLLMKHKVARSTATARRQAKEQEIAVASKALEDLGKQVTQSYAPLSGESTGVGRVSAALIAAANASIEQERARLRSAVHGETEREVQDERADRMRCIAALESLLSTHDLPGSEHSYQIIWKDAVAKAQTTAIAKYATATMALDIPASSIFASELRVDRLVENAEIMALEDSGWLKKSAKFVPHRIGRFVITRITVTSEQTTIRLRGLPEMQTELDLTVPATGDVVIERIGTVGLREPSADGKQGTVLRQLADKLSSALQSLDKRTQLIVLDVDGKPLLDHPSPSVLAERLVEVIAPVMQNIRRHSRNPDELVLRRQLGEDRREEIFVPIKELVAKLDGLPPEARQVFVPLGLVSDEPLLAAEAPVRRPPPTPILLTNPRTRDNHSTVNLDSSPELLADDLVREDSISMPTVVERPTVVVVPAAAAEAAIEAALDAMYDAASTRAAEAAEVAEVAGAAGAAEVVEVVEAVEAAEAVEVAEVAGAAGVAGAEEVEEAAEVVEAAEAAEAADVAEADVAIAVAAADSGAAATVGEVTEGESSDIAKRALPRALIVQTTELVPLTRPD